jgi:hypothetical protein
MNSRPLLDYLAHSDDFPEPSPAAPAMSGRPIDSLEARLKDLEARLRASQPVVAAPARDLTLSAQIDAILTRRAASQALPSGPAAFRHAAPQSDFAEPASRHARVVIDPPPSVPVSNDPPAVNQDFLKFSEAVYLIGQAARRFIEEPQAQIQAQPAPRQVASAPSTGDIEALSAVLRETVSAFRSVADDLAVSAGEIRNYATRPERPPERLPERQRPQPARQRDEDEILELRESIADLQERLDDLLHARRRARY